MGGDAIPERPRIHQGRGPKAGEGDWQPFLSIGDGLGGSSKLGLHWALDRVFGFRGAPFTGQNALWCRASAIRAPNGRGLEVWGMRRQQAHVGTWFGIQGPAPMCCWLPGHGEAGSCSGGIVGCPVSTCRRQRPRVGGGGSCPPEVLSWRIFLQLFLREGGSWLEARETRMPNLCVPQFSGQLGKGPWAGEPHDTCTQLRLGCSSGEGGKPGAWVLCSEGPNSELCSCGELTGARLGTSGHGTR